MSVSIPPVAMPKRRPSKRSKKRPQPKPQQTATTGVGSYIELNALRTWSLETDGLDEMRRPGVDGVAHQAANTVTGAESDAKAGTYSNATENAIHPSFPFRAQPPPENMTQARHSSLPSASTTSTTDPQLPNSIHPHFSSTRCFMDIFRRRSTPANRPVSTSDGTCHSAASPPHMFHTMMLPSQSSSTSSRLDAIVDTPGSEQDLHLAYYFLDPLLPSVPDLVHSPPTISQGLKSPISPRNQLSLTTGPNEQCTSTFSPERADSQPLLTPPTSEDDQHVIDDLEIVTCRLESESGSENESRSPFQLVVRRKPGLPHTKSSPGSTLTTFTRNPGIFQRNSSPFEYERRVQKCRRRLFEVEDESRFAAMAMELVDLECKASTSTIRLTEIERKSGRERAVRTLCATRQIIQTERSYNKHLRNGLKVRFCVVFHTKLGSG